MWPTGPNYAETENKENELVRFSLPRCYSICGRRPNYAEAESNASLLTIAEAQQYMWPTGPNCAEAESNASLLAIASGATAYAAIKGRIAQEKPRISAIPHKEPVLSGTLLPDGICSLDDRKPA